MRFRVWRVSVFIILGVGVVIWLLTTSSPSISHGGLSEYNRLALNASALDCTEKQRCRFRHTTTRPVNCNEWYPGMEEDKLNCNRTAEDATAVTYVPDTANYIQSNFTALNYTAIATTPGFRKPWDLEFVNEQTALVTQKTGELLRYHNGSVTQIDSIPVVDKKLAGLMGLAVDPRFHENNYLYVQYTTAFNNSYAKENYFITNRISRFQLTSQGLVNETVLLDNLPGNIYHAGGRLEFGSDNFLYATTGDAGMMARSQDPAFLGGKILRLRPNGSIPASNPFADTPVYSRGHRNPQGLAWKPDTDQLYAMEHGPWRFDELNRIVAGGNYGWGTYKCRTELPAEMQVTAPHKSHNTTQTSTLPSENATVPPIRCYKEWTLAPSGMTFVDAPNHPWHNDLFVAGLRGRHLRHIVLQNGTIQEESIFYFQQNSPSHTGISRRFRDVEFHNGQLWVLGDWSGLIRLQPPLHD